MKTLFVSLIAAAIGSAFVLAPPAEAKSRKHKHSVTQVKRGHVAYARHGYEGGVLSGPLYNGQDYLGTDPDPNIRSYILRDLNGRYGGGR